MNRLRGTDPIDVGYIAFNGGEKAYLERLVHSRRPRNRKLCLQYLDHSLLTRQNRNFNLCLLDRLVTDKVNDIRWHAFRAVGDFVHHHPKKVWPFVVKYGSTPNNDIRAAVACLLLEHLLGEHFNDYFPKVRRIVLNGNQRFLYTLRYCWRQEQTLKQWDEMASLIKDARRRKMRGA